MHIAVLHGMHHAYSDTPEDPHSPVQKPFFAMMWRTHLIYHDLKTRRVAPEARFEGRVPSWPLVDEKLLLWPGTVAWIALYSLVYVAFATEWWMFLLLPVHFLLGPIHGGIVNYFGHKLGYRNFATRDNSKNTLVFDVLTMGELFQNNHHKHPMSTNFGARWFELNPAYQIMRVLAALRIIHAPRSAGLPALHEAAGVPRLGPGPVAPRGAT